jgi:uncharacterized protein (DUF2236 family)
MTGTLDARHDVDSTALTPLGPESLTWRYFGLMVGFAYGAVPQLLQLMHPELGHAVDEHSNVKDDPFDRLIRSMGPIYGVIYDGPDAAETARAVRGFHERITGTMPDGQRYSALNPELFHWAHATFVHALIYGSSTVLGPFTRAEQEQLYAESRQWYRLYGMTMRNVPETLDEFDAYWEHYVHDVLEHTNAAHWLLETFRSPPAPPGLEWVPKPLWRLVRRPLGHAAVVYASGLLPPASRDALQLPWGRLQYVQYDLIRRMLRMSVRVTPVRYRYHPRPLSGWRREAERIGVPVRRLVNASGGRRHTVGAQ